MGQSPCIWLENALGEANHSAKDIILNSFAAAGLSAVLAGITKMIKLPGFTGRGSISQVAGQINTKFFNGTIGGITGKTLMKLFAYNGGYSLFNTIVLGIIDGIEHNIKILHNAPTALIPSYGKIGFFY